jgi:hypothetical protein
MASLTSHGDLQIEMTLEYFECHGPWPMTSEESLTWYGAVAIASLSHARSVAFCKERRCSFKKKKKKKKKKKEDVDIFTIYS